MTAPKVSLNADNQVLERIETSAASTNPRDVYYYFAGVKVGDNSNNGTSETDYATAIANRSVVSGTGAFRFGATSGTQFADFDQSYQAVNPNGTSPTNTTYTVTEGETLQTVAAAVWGDASLWYLIADANGLTSVDSLATGMSLVIPNKVTNVHNTSETFRPYDPNKAIGDTSPTTPKPPPKKGCGVLGQIIMVVVAIAVVAITKDLGLAAKILTAFEAAGLPTAVAAVATGATIAATASIASQGVGLAIGAIDKFSWNAVALAAITAGVTEGLDAIPGVGSALATADKAGAFAGGVVRGALANAVTQGIAVATGLQDKFDWTGVAVAGVISGVTSWASEAIENHAVDAAVAKSNAAHAGDPFSEAAFAGAHEAALAALAGPLSVGGAANQALSGAAGVIAGAAGHSLVDGSDFGDNLLAALPDVIGNTIGSMIAGGLSAKSLDPKRQHDGKDNTQFVGSSEEFKALFPGASSPSRIDDATTASWKNGRVEVTPVATTTAGEVLEALTIEEPGVLNHAPTPDFGDAHATVGSSDAVGQRALNADLDHGHPVPGYTETASTLSESDGLILIQNSGLRAVAPRGVPVPRGNQPRYPRDPTTGRARPIGPDGRPPSRTNPLDPPERTSITEAGDAVSTMGDFIDEMRSYFDTVEAQSESMDVMSMIRDASVIDSMPGIYMTRKSVDITYKTSYGGYESFQIQDAYQFNDTFSTTFGWIKVESPLGKTGNRMTYRDAFVEIRLQDGIVDSWRMPGTPWQGGHPPVAKFYWKGN